MPDSVFCEVVNRKEKKKKIDRTPTRVKLILSKIARGTKTNDDQEQDVVRSGAEQAKDETRYHETGFHSESVCFCFPDQTDQMEENTQTRS